MIKAIRELMEVLVHLQFFPSEEQDKLWNVVCDGTPTGDIVYERDDAPGRYFIMLNTASLNVMGNQMSYRSLDDVSKQLRFYYTNCLDKPLAAKPLA